MKTAVFQIDEQDGTFHLVCVPLESLHAASNLESRLQGRTGGKKEIRLLGRFDSVRLAANEQEAEALILGNDGLTVEEVVDRILLRSLLQS